jgi:Fic family protein
MANFQRSVPFNKLPPLPPKIDVETKAVMRKAISAGRALAQLNGTLLTLPNPSIFLDTIYLQEAKASSEVENIITTNDDLYRSMVADRTIENGQAKEVLFYKDALWLGLNELNKKPFITTNLCIKIVQCITQNSSSIRKIPGTTLSNTRGEVIYTPPLGEALIREKLANWEKFVNEYEGLDPLIKMAIMHYQFEAIHPFADGNGRTGRILLLLYLKLSGMLDTPAIYLSQYINRNRVDYYNTLRGVTERSDWETYILYMLDMVEQTAIMGMNRLSAISDAMQSMVVELKRDLPKVYSKELVDLLFKLPYTKRQHLVEAKIGNLKTVGQYLMELERHGLLSAEKVGKEKLYVNRTLINILEKRF